MNYIKTVLGILLVLVLVGCKEIPTNFQQESDLITPDISEELTSDDEHIEIPQKLKELGYNEEAYIEIEKLKAEGKPVPTELVVKLENVSRTDFLKRLYEQTSNLVVTDDGLNIETIAEINENELNCLEPLVAYSDYKDRAELFNIVKRLHYHDFSNIVIDHNYLWKELNDGRGKALKVKPETLEILPISEETKKLLDSLYDMDSRRISGELRLRF